MLFAAIPPPSWLFAAGFALVTTILLRQVWRKRRRRRNVTKPQPVRRSASRLSASRLLDAPTDVGMWQVEMHELARELKAELDTKIRVCQETIRQARLEQERLQELLKRTRQVS